jgi:uncharacterized protein YbjT (DUF2867 family)
VSNPPTLITGATGFVGGRLVEALRESAGVRVLVRDASKLEAPDELDVVEGDLGDEEDVERALDGCRVAYYLVHSMETGNSGGFASRDKKLAKRFVAAAGRLGVERIV